MPPGWQERYEDSYRLCYVRQLADEFSAAGSQAGDDGVDVLDGECDMADTPCVRRRVPVVALGRRRVMARRESSSS